MKTILRIMIIAGILATAIIPDSRSLSHAAGVEPGSPQAAQIERVSVASDGTQANNISWWHAISGDGRYVAFSSPATNLVAGDTNGYDDVFVHDRLTGLTERVSIASDGSQANNHSRDCALSADGRYVAFWSYASNLVTADTNPGADIFVRDRQTGQTERVSIASDGSESDGESEYPSISADGRYVAFASNASTLVSNDTNGAADIFVRDRQTGQTELVSIASDGSQGNDLSLRPAISADGRYVAFASYANTLVTNDTNAVTDIFVRDRQTGQTERVSLAGDGSQANNWSFVPAISADGRYVTFYSWADNLVGGDTNAVEDVFLRDRQTGITERISVASDGSQGNLESRSSAISEDGRYVAFSSGANNLVSGDENGSYDIFLRDRQAGTTVRLSVDPEGNNGNAGSHNPKITADGSQVAFHSGANNLVSGDTNGYIDIFVYTEQGGTPTPTERISVSSEELQGNDMSYAPHISGDGRYVTFTSFANNLVADDTNGVWDGFLRDRYAGTTERISIADDEAQANDGCIPTAISADGRFVAFVSLANNLVSGDTNSTFDIFVRDRQNAATERVSLASGGLQANDGSGGGSISGDGRYVAFTSSASNLAPGDTNGEMDVFVYDRQMALTERVSVASDGGQGNDFSTSDAISADGRYVAFSSYATNLVIGDTNAVADVFVHDRQTGQTWRVSVASDGSQANDASGRPFLSRDGRYISFSSDASNLVTGDTNGAEDVFVHNLQTGQTARVSVSSAGEQGNDGSDEGVIAANGIFVAFRSFATNLVGGDVNGAVDVFIHNRLTGETTLVSLAGNGAQGNMGSDNPSISANGLDLAFDSYASNLVSGDTNEVVDVFALQVDDRWYDYQVFLPVIQR